MLLRLGLWLKKTRLFYRDFRPRPVSVWLISFKPRPETERDLINFLEKRYTEAIRADKDSDSH